MAIWSFGEMSPLKFEISDKLADNYNAAIKEFFRAPQRFNQKFGRRWNPKKDPIILKWSRKHQRAWDTFGTIMSKAIIEQGPIHVNDLYDDFLVKNAVEAPRKASRVVSIAAGIGVVYVLYRGIKTGR